MPTVSALEIGPFNAPKLKGPGVAYFDVMDQRDLRMRATALGLDPLHCPPIDFVAPNGDLSIVGRAFDVVFSSHCVEHQPDLIRHLIQVEKLLTPGGAYHLIVPDKRVCFDHYLPESTLADIRAAWTEQRTVHTPAAVLNHRLRTTHNNKFLHWLGRHGPRPPELKSGARLEAAMAEAKRAGEGDYVDVHAWCFTPRGFREIILGLRGLGLIGLAVEAVHTTLPGAFEFFAVLRKPANH
ncbi:MAG: hypothetical protein EXQ84_05835 [Rhodospirillaceae bacterium]|nr:hypothetical protein [Rhodospirillaceae bacterium]